MSSELCQLAGDWKGELPPEGMAYESKIDGFRAIYVRNYAGEPCLFTRGGLRIEGTAHILHRCQLFGRIAGQPLFLDGEFVVDGTLAATKAWFERGWEQGGEAGHFHVFDVVPMVNWVQGRWDWPWARRKAWLASLAHQVETDAALAWEWREGSRGRDDGASPVTVIEDGWVFDHADVLAEVRRVWAANGEGLVLKDASAPYLRRRCDAWAKVKRENAHKWMHKAA